MKDPKKYIRKNILALQPYSTARDEFQGGDISAWLDANESPYPNGVNRYPDPHQKELKATVARLMDMPAESIFIGGAGSDEAIDLVYRIFCTPGRDNAIAIAPSYGVYRVAADINDIALREVLLNEDFSLPVERLLEAVDPLTKVIWICSPNNPTGNAFPKEDILRIADGFDGIVVVDEAYVDFSSKGTLLHDITSHPNLIVLRTFSKAWGMAGMRAGMAFAATELIEYFDRVKYPYNMSSLIQEELIRRINLGTDNHIPELKKEALRLSETLAQTPAVLKVYPTDANFILIKTHNADKLYDYLIENGVIVRNRSRMPLCEGTLRITVGTPEENERVITIISNYR